MRCAMAQPVVLYATEIERFAGRLHPFRFIGINEGARVEGAKVGDVAVARIADIAVGLLLAVFLNLAGGPDEDRVELGDFVLDGLEEVIFFTQGFRHDQGVVVVFPDKALVKRAADRDVVAPAVHMPRVFDSIELLFLTDFLFR